MALAVFIDFTKAFDYLNHNLLLKKLYLSGIRGQALVFLESYLSNRKQFVYLNGFSPRTKSIFSSVPQGSILGPLLFNIYIHDIVNVDPLADFVMYADDTTLLFSAKTSDELINCENVSLADLHNWTLENGLKINSSKTKAIFFRTKNKSVFITKIFLINSNVIEIVENFKSLGVIFNQYLS